MSASAPFKPGRFFILGLFLIVAVVAADQYTKWLVMETMLRASGEPLDFMKWLMTENKVSMFEDGRESYNTVILAPFLNFVMVWNQGISFGLFDTSDPRMALVFIGISLTIAMGMLIWLVLARRLVLSVGLSLIVGGAIGNIVDRVRFGAVADFIDLHVGNQYHWPAFNLADSCIVLGAFLLIVDAMTGQGKGTLLD